MMNAQQWHPAYSQFGHETETSVRPAAWKLRRPIATAIELRGITYAYGEGALRRPLLQGIDLSVGAGEIVMLTGPSGSGKTTLMTLIGALRAMQGGSARVLGQDLAGAEESDRMRLRRRIGFIFQDHNLLGFLTARQNVALALEQDGMLREPERLALAGALLDAVGLAGHEDRVPTKLSGGQRLRVAVARALAADPGLVLADEPTAALDRTSGHEVARLLHDLARERNVPILMVTHDPRILHLADRVIALEDGRIVKVAVNPGRTRQRPTPTANTGSQHRQRSVWLKAP
jgi:putative ABC transport system ATP-binding protein